MTHTAEDRAGLDLLFEYLCAVRDAQRANANTVTPGQVSSYLQQHGYGSGLDFVNGHNWSAQQVPLSRIESVSAVNKGENDTHPVILLDLGAGQLLRVIDGHHRVLDARVAGKSTIDAWVGVGQ